MSILASLTASAETFDAIGLTFDAEFTRDLARSYVIYDREWGSEEADRQFRHWTAQQAVRAVDKTQQYHMRSAA